MTATMLYSLITLPGDFMASTTAYIGSVFSDTYIIIALAIGLPLAFWFIRRVIGLVRARG